MQIITPDVLNKLGRNELLVELTARSLEAERWLRCEASKVS